MISSISLLGLLWGRRGSLAGVGGGMGGLAGLGVKGSRPTFPEGNILTRVDAESGSSLPSTQPLTVLT